MAVAPHRLVAPGGRSLADAAVAQLVAAACPANDYRDRRVLLIIPDGTRTAPVGLMFQALFAQIGSTAQKFDVMLALGTHPPMPADAINQRVGITAEQRASIYKDVEFINHEWNNPAALRDLGRIPADEIRALTGGLFAMDVPVHVNQRLFDYDQLIIIGPVFPHEVVGFSGGNKYLFPGVAGPGILNFFHWLGAVVTNPMIKRLGYHCVQYFLKQWDKFKNEPWGTLAHSTHGHGIGTDDEQTGIETPRIRVTLATGIPEAVCQKINLGYRDWRTIKQEDFAHREAEGIFLEPKAGERLYHLRDQPAWAGGALS